MPTRSQSASRLVSGEAASPEPRPATPPHAPRALLPYGRQWIEADDVEALTLAASAPFLTQGPSVKAFEDALAEVCGAPYAVAVSSGTAALHLAALAAGAGPGTVGITSPLTFVA